GSTSETDGNGVADSDGCAAIDCSSGSDTAAACAPLASAASGAEAGIAGEGDATCGSGCGGGEGSAASGTSREGGSIAATGLVRSCAAFAAFSSASAFVSFVGVAAEGSAPSATLLREATEGGGASFRNSSCICSNERPSANAGGGAGSICRASS